MSAALGLRYLQSFGAMRFTMGYMTPREQLETQQICVWFYKHGSGRVQTSIILVRGFFTYYRGGVLDANVLSVSFSGHVRLLTCDDSDISHKDWLSVQVDQY